LILEKVSEWVEAKYRSTRRPDVVYAHYLDKSIYAVDHEEKLTPQMAVGELIHAGVERMLGEPRETCREVPVEPVDSEPARRFIKEGPRGPYVLLCGTPDAVVDGRPVEVKTTRRNGSPPREWATRARIYGYLYAAKAYLVVINVITGHEHVYELDPLTDEEASKIITAWLRGLYPAPTLPALAKAGVPHDRDQHTV